MRFLCPFFISLDTYEVHSRAGCRFIFHFKGTVQRKLTGVLSDINRKLMICHCSDGYSFFDLKGLRSLKSKNVFSALTGTLF
jgi:hypothetical protein